MKSFFRANPSSIPNAEPLVGLEQTTDVFLRQIELRVHWVQGSPQARFEVLAELTDWMDHQLARVSVDTGMPSGACWTAALHASSQLIDTVDPGTWGLVQLNTAPGDLSGNAQAMMRYIHMAEDLGLEALVFPELSLMGYPIRDVITRHPWLVDENIKWLQALARVTGNTRVLVGFVEPRRSAPNRPLVGRSFFNSVAVLSQGKIQGIVRKRLLPTYGEYEDDRTFEPSPASGIHPAETLSSAIWGIQQPVSTGAALECVSGLYGITICEDIWNDPDFFDHQLHHHCPVDEVAWSHPEPDVLVNVSASVSRSRKEQMKHNLLSHVARRHKKPVVYVNQVGSVDECSFDGASRVYNAAGELIARGASFQQQLLLVHPTLGHGFIHPLSQGLEPTLRVKHPPKVFDAFDDSDLGRTYHVLVQGIRDYFKKTGFQRALLGLSGGIDSAVVSVLLADALGPHNVLALSFPTDITPDDNRDDAHILAQNLGIGWAEIPIGSIVDPFLQGIDGERKTLNQFWGKVSDQSYAADNVQAISRATLLRLLGNDYNALPIATSDKSEFYLGYTTVNGDMSGALAPLGDVPKTKVRLLARWLNTERGVPNAIPEAVITRPSGADLAIDPATGKNLTAESVLMPYEFADEVIWRIEALHQGQADMLRTSFFYEGKYGTLPPERKEQWLNRFFRRMAASVFKWWLAPPVLLVEGNGSITKTDYHHPITAGRIVWRGHDEDEIQRLLRVATRPQDPLATPSSGNSGSPDNAEKRAF